MDSAIASNNGFNLDIVFDIKKRFYLVGNDDSFKKQHGTAVWVVENVKVLKV